MEDRVIASALERPELLHDSPFEAESRSPPTNGLELNHQQSFGGSDRSSQSFGLSTVHSGAPLELTVSLLSLAML